MFQIWDFIASRKYRKANRDALWRGFSEMRNSCFGSMVTSQLAVGLPMVSYKVGHNILMASRAQTTANQKPGFL